MAADTREEIILEDWKTIPLSSKAVISRKSGCGLLYRFGSSDASTGIEMTEPLVADSDVSFKCISGSAVLFITTIS